MGGSRSKRQKEGELNADIVGQGRVKKPSMPNAKPIAERKGSIKIAVGTRVTLVGSSRPQTQYVVCKSNYRQPLNTNQVRIQPVLQGKRGENKHALKQRAQE